MNIDEIKTVWKKDMNALESRIKINETKIKELEFNKATTTFDKFLKISLFGKNMALVYALISLLLIIKLWQTPVIAIIVGIGLLSMIFSYFQHSSLKKLDLTNFSLLALQKEISKFRKHTAETAIYDFTIIFIWMTTLGIGIYQLISKNNIIDSFKTGIVLSTAILFWFVFAYFGGKKIYKNIDIELKSSEYELNSLKMYQEY
ncbi:hypothetical protein [Polaribacter sp. Asnod1-A03]|uniref:hypothetical protein n=1 Tax=Polaribacter sp. Asnod1-A03 TaxID=3160581 RepID=UPI00386399D6